MIKFELSAALDSLTAMAGSSEKLQSQFAKKIRNLPAGGYEVQQINSTAKWTRTQLSQEVRSEA